MKTLAELQAIRETMKAQLSNRGTADSNNIRIVVGMATCGIASGARPVLSAITAEVEQRGLSNVKISQTGCIGICRYEPIVEVILPNQEKVTYVLMTPEKIKTVISSHIINGKAVDEYTYETAVKNYGGTSIKC